MVKGGFTRGKGTCPRRRGRGGPGAQVTRAGGGGATVSSEAAQLGVQIPAAGLGGGGGAPPVLSIVSAGGR